MTVALPFKSASVTVAALPANSELRLVSTLVGVEDGWNWI
jgi:hypothetical protein